MATTSQVNASAKHLEREARVSKGIAAFALLLIAALVLSVVTAGDNVLQIDVSFTRFVQDQSTTVRSAIEDFGNAFGAAKVGVPVGILAAALLFLTGSPGGGALLLAATTMRAANYGFKFIIDSPRPTSDLVEVRSNLDSNGFPSGHAHGATLLCGAILIAIWPIIGPRLRVVASLLAIVAILATAMARVSVGAHWPTDVLGGIMWGVIILTLLTVAIGRFERSRNAKSSEVSQD